MSRRRLIGEKNNGSQFSNYEEALRVSENRTEGANRTQFGYSIY